MKRIFFIAVIFFITCHTTAQKSISYKEDYKNRSVVSSAGASFQNDVVSISWTLGDALFTLSEDNTEEIPSDMLELSRSIKAYPNPTNDNLFIINSTENVESLYIYIYDLAGKIILHKKTTSLSTVLNLQHLTSALYLIKILNSNSQVVKSSKILKY